MKILSIETSCDETGVSIIDGAGEHISILGNALASQVDLHAQYGGVFPAMAKRAHAEKFIPLLSEALTQANMLIEGVSNTDHVSEICEKDEILKAKFLDFFSKYSKPDIDYIAVTTGPGLEPALWVGITAAKALSASWGIPLIPINHMEGHVLVTVLEKHNDKNFSLMPFLFPSLALLVSGGHTELVLMHDYSKYEKIGQTRDDAVGEAFDKIARMLGLPYPGGPAVSRLAKEFREKGIDNQYSFPRPMMHSKDYDFSFSGIKTAVLYTIRDKGEINDEDKMMISCAFEDACIEVLVHKTKKAVEEYNAQSVIIGGGVAGNTYLRSELTKAINTKVLFPETWLATDNSVMIAVAAYVRALKGNQEEICSTVMRADGNLSITDGGFRK